MLPCVNGASEEWESVAASSILAATFDMWKVTDLPQKYALRLNKMPLKFKLLVHLEGSS